MPIFDSRFYRLGNDPYQDVEGYQAEVIEALGECARPVEREGLLRGEVVEITRHITDGIRDLIKTDRRIRNLVLNQGAVPLSTWTQALDTMAEHSIPMLKQKIAEMQRELEQGRVEGFPGTMFLYNKPTFVTFAAFYAVIFELAEAPQ